MKSNVKETLLAGYVSVTAFCSSAEAMRSGRGGNAELENKVLGAVTEILGSSQPRAPSGFL